MAKLPPHHHQPPPGGAPEHNPADAQYSRKTSFDMQSVRAVPARAGDLVLWEGRVLHWSSSADGGAEGGDRLQSRLASAFWARGAPSPAGCGALRHFPALPWNARLYRASAGLCSGAPPGGGWWWCGCSLATGDGEPGGQKWSVLALGAS